MAEKKKPVAKATTASPVMSKIKLKRNLFMQDGKRWKGEIIEVDDKFARQFVSAGRATFVDDE